MVVRFYVPNDEETFLEYFDPDGPERSLEFFISTHTKQMGSFNMEHPPSVGDAVMLNKKEDAFVRGRLFGLGGECVSILVSPAISADFYREPS